MKKNLEIIDFENKATNTTPPKVYTRFKTNEGWMSCFSTTESAKLKEFKGKSACVEVKESIANQGTENEKVFQNIDKCLGEASVILENEKPRDEQPDAVKPGISVKSNDIQVGVYTSYAKDIFCALKEEPFADNTARMKESIARVEQAKEAFE